MPRLVAQSCPTLCDPIHVARQEDSPGKNTGVGCHAFFQGIVPTQGSNPGLQHCQQILYQLNHQGSPQTYLHRPKFQASRFLPYRLHSPGWEPAPGMKGVGRQDEYSQWKTSLCADSNRVCSPAGAQPHLAAGASLCAGGHLPSPAQNHPPLPGSDAWLPGGCASPFVRWTGSRTPELEGALASSGSDSSFLSEEMGGPER